MCYHGDSRGHYSIAWSAGEKEASILSKPPTLALGALLKQFRVAAGLTQDELAERACLSVRAISDLERGVRRAPHKDTLTLLAEALTLNEGDRVVFMEAARATRGAGVLPAPPSAHTTVFASSLSAPLTPLVGREREEAAIAHLLSRTDVRLLTLTGPAGIGKTRLAQQVATNLCGRFADGVVFVSLAPLSEQSLVLPAIAQALSLQEQASQTPHEQLQTYLAEKELLLVLDNFEQVAGAAADVAAVLTACPRVKALVTSRAVLRVRGEQEFGVPPLDTPDLGHLPALDDIAQYAAVALFVRRAQAVRPTFALTPALAPTVAAISARLDGLPLAIELAAARIKLLAPQALLARLDRGLPLLTHGSADLPERQQTMRGAIAWSFDLLDEHEQRLFRRLAVFSGGWTSEAAEAVCGEDGEQAVDILDGLTSLVDKSLVVQAEDVGGEPRFRLLELIHEYGLERLVGAGEEAWLRQRHADYFLKFAEAAEPHLKVGDQAHWLERLASEHANLRSALAWAREHHDVEVGLRLAGALSEFWRLRGHVVEGRAWLEELLALNERQSESAVSGAIRAKALGAVGSLAWAQADGERATAWLEEALALRRQLGDKAEIANALLDLSLAVHLRGEVSSATPLLEECLALRRELGDKHGVAEVLLNLGYECCENADYGRAFTLMDEGLTLATQLGIEELIAIGLHGLGALATRQGNYTRAAMLLERCLALRRKVEHKRGMALTMCDLGDVALALADLERARELYEHGLALCREVGDQWHIALMLASLGEVLTHQGDYARAIELSEQSLTLARALAAHSIVDAALRNLGRVARLQGNLERARALCLESMLVFDEADYEKTVVENLEALAEVECDEGLYAYSARLYGAASAWRDATGSPRSPLYQRAFEQNMSAIRGALGEEALAAAETAGRAMPLEQVVQSLA